MAAKRKKSRPARSTIVPEFPPFTSRTCGYRIVRGVRLDEREAHPDEIVPLNHCAFATYAVASSGGVPLAQPTVAFYGPGQRIRASFGGGSAMYSLVGGIVFKNC